jgi:hypothetical protein
MLLEGQPEPARRGIPWRSHGTRREYVMLLTGREYSMNDNKSIAAALGKQLWNTDSFVPKYRSGELGLWRINPGGQLVYDRGYYSGTCLLEMLPSLSRKVVSKGGSDGDRWETWMSLTPLEVESQELGYRYASGDVVIMGLGMGWVAANAALNPKVSMVTVIECDPDVISLIRESGAFDSLATHARQKINIINADAMEWSPGPGHSVDFLYADIWLHLAEPETMEQVRQMQKNVQAKQVYFWGQEITIHSAISRIAKNDEVINADLVRQAVADVINLPLLIPDDRDYPQMIQQVIANRIERQLPVDVRLV